MKTPRSWSPSCAAAAVVLALLLCQSTPAPAVLKVPPVAADANAPCTRWCEPIRLYEEQFGLPSRGHLGEVFQRADRLGYKLDALVALVPDPLDPGLTYRSEEVLEAIQRGFADQGFLPVRQWFPWQGEAAKTRRYQREPGALLFRRLSAKSKELTVVLLIGETSRGGGYNDAFQEALALAEELRYFGGLSHPLRILGPTFSETKEWLVISLRDWLERYNPAEPQTSRPDVHIVTGSASAPGLEQSFDQLGPAVRMKQMVIPDDELERQAYRYLENALDWDFQKVALLIELDTDYGRAALDRLAAAADSKEPLPGSVVAFPSHLAQIRTAREKMRPPKEDQPEELTGGLPQALDMDLANETGEHVDGPARSLLSVARNDLVLSKELEALCGEARYIGILSTSLQDRLFLAEQVRSRCPDVVLFTFDNHVLASHPRVIESMEGSLVLTSFPLAVEGTGDRMLRQSASALQSGIVLAVRRLLGGDVQPLSRLWIMAVGQRGLWPIVQLDGPRGLKEDSSARIAGTQGRTFQWMTAALVFALLAFWLWRLSRPIQLLDAGIWTGGIPDARFFPFVGMASLALISGVLLVFYALPLWSHDGFRTGFLSGRVIPWVANLLVLAAVYYMLISMCAGLLRPASRWRLSSWRALAWSAGALLLLVVLHLGILNLWVLPEGEEYFYSRAGDFGSGFSPLVSLACLLATVYAWAQLGIRQRRASLVEGVPWPLSPAAASEPLATCGRLAEEIDRSLLRWFPGLLFWLGLIIALCLPLKRLWDIQPIAERVTYGWVFLALVALGCTLGAIAFNRFIRTWRELERILDLLCHSWLLGAFRQEKNSSFYDWKPLRSFGWRMPPHKMPLLTAEALRDLTSRGLRGADGAALVPGEDLDRGVRAALQAEQEGALEPEARARHELQECFAKATQALDVARAHLPPGHQELAREIDRFLSLRVVGWLRYVFAQLRYSLISAGACGLFVLIGVSAYAFQPKRYLGFWIWAALLIAGLLSLRIFVRMDRNTVLSAISGTAPGQVSFDRTFFSNLLTYVGIPALGVIFTQFPVLGDLLGEWLEPLLDLLSRFLAGSS